MKRSITLTISVLIAASLLVSPALASPRNAPTAGTTTRVSVASNGTQGNDASQHAAISANGRSVAFQSGASNLGSGDTNNTHDVFVHDWETGQTTLVSVHSNGTQGNDLSLHPSISATGRFVAFDSFANTLVSDDTNTCGPYTDGTCPDIFVHDRATGQTTRISVASDGTQANGYSDVPSISANGRFVAFHSFATNLVSDDTNGVADVFVYDLKTGQTMRVSVASNGTQANDNSDGFSISATGRYVAFHSFATNLVSGDTNSTSDVFVHNRASGQTTRVSVVSNGTQGNGGSYDPSISATGRSVAFYSDASNLVSGDTNSIGDIFIHDQQGVASTLSWQPIVSDGFGDANNQDISALEEFKGKLYAEATNYFDGATIWRSANGSAWTQVTAPGFDSAYGANNPFVFDMVVFNGKLYAGTGSWEGAPSAGQIWRSANGTDWSLVAADGLGNPNNFGFTTFASFKGMLYVAAHNGSDGADLWRSKTGNEGSWELVATQGFGNGSAYFIITSLNTFKGELYAAVEATAGTGAQVWRSSNGTDWTLVSEDGFGDSDNYQTGGSAVHGGQLYMTTRNDVTGAQLWRSKNGVTWVQVVGDGFGDANNVKIESLTTYASNLYAVTNNPLDNPVTGAKVWRSTDGVNWTQINEDGFGDSNTGCGLWSNGTVVFRGNYLTGCSGPNGGAIWQLQR